MKPGRRSIAALAAVAALTLAGCGEGEPTGGYAGQERFTSEHAFDAERAFDDLEHMVALGPRPAGSAANAKQARFLRRELRRAGLSDVAIGVPYRNVTGVIPGREPGYVVVGAHHDTKDVPDLVGANDGASGAALVLELARALRKPLEGPSIAIALFDAEEARGERDFERDGLRGSRRYVEQARDGGDPRAGIPPLDEIRAMVLFDMVGDCDLQIPRELSSDEQLYDAFAEAAGGEPFSGVTAPILDDHVPFREAGIPAVDLIDFTYGGRSSPGEYWHTSEDTLDKVCPESLGAVGKAALEALPSIR